jgi:hypothetical protein
MFETERPLSKRQLGWLLILFGAAVAALLLTVTGFDPTPAARILITLALAVTVIGLTLLPFGDSPV